MLYKKVQCKSCIKAMSLTTCVPVGIYCMLDQNILWPGLKADVMVINLKLVFVVVNFFNSGNVC